MPVMGGSSPTVQVTVPVPAPAPMSKPKAPPQPVPQNANSPLQPAPAGMQPQQIPQPLPTGIILPWAPPKKLTLPKKQFAKKYAKASPWYSHALRVIEQKVPNRATADQVRKTLLNNGVKPDEMKWGGIEDFLKKAETETGGSMSPSFTGSFVDKSELLKIAHSNRVQWKEKVRGGLTHTPVSADAVSSAKDQWKEAADRHNILLHKRNDLDNQIDRLRERHAEAPPQFTTQRLIGVSGFRNRPATKFKVVNYIPREYADGKLVWSKHSESPGLVSRTGGYPVGDLRGRSLSDSEVDRYEEWKEKRAAPPQAPPELQTMIADAKDLQGQIDQLKSHRDSLYVKLQKLQKGKTTGSKTMFGPDSNTQGNYAFKGGTNYREMTLSLPDQFVAKGKVGHFDDNPNVFAHIRFNDMRGPNGEKLLHVDEVQSDMHQNERSDAPFRKTWHELSMRRMLKHAVDKGYDGLSWTPGHIHADRYNLGKYIDTIVHSPNDDGISPNPERTYDIYAFHKGVNVHTEHDLSADKVRGLLGNALGNKIIAGHGDDLDPQDGIATKLPQLQQDFGWKKLEGPVLQIGGEFHKRLYDKKIPEYLNKYAKPFGAQVGQIEVQTSNPTDPLQTEKVPFLPVTPAMKESIKKEGQVLFQRSPREIVKYLRGRFAKKKYAAAPNNRSALQKQIADLQSQLAALDKQEAAERPDDDMLDFGMDSYLSLPGTEKGASHSQAPDQSYKTQGRSRRQLLLQMLTAAKAGHYDETGMTPRDYIKDVEDREKPVTGFQNELYDPFADEESGMKESGQPPKKLSRSRKYAASPEGVHSVLSNVQREPQNALHRYVASDVLEGVGRHEEADLLHADPPGSIVNHRINEQGRIPSEQLRVVPSRYTTRHIDRAHHALYNHVYAWSGGEMGELLPTGTDWADVGGVANEGENENNGPGSFTYTHEIHPQGTVSVMSDSDMFPSFMHHSELGPHLADEIDNYINNDDYGWNTPPDLADGTADDFQENEAEYNRLLEALRNAPYTEPTGFAYYHQR